MLLKCLNFTIFIFNNFERRMRRWIQEKHLRDKNTNTNTIRRHRHRSLGDVETSSKNKRHLPPHSVQVIKLSIT